MNVKRILKNWVEAIAIFSVYLWIVQLICIIATVAVSLFISSLFEVPLEQIALPITFIVTSILGGIDIFLMFGKKNSPASVIMSSLVLTFRLIKSVVFGQEFVRQNAGPSVGVYKLKLVIREIWGLPI
ncbi:hypothetical protein MsAg5_16550 [Methanosarcinaceae archaeon Ag5]|uniref:Uncharacterized protein n=1 Tax=Methanolapillus africanus TaxID=3028297 RepID=A0AAE4SDT7_9EURY|nr:hypothetical protein [Methanosarcinaceae archaeon Ag5]